MSEPIIELTCYQSLDNSERCNMCNNSPVVELTLGRQYGNNKSAMSILMCEDCFNKLRDKFRINEDDLK